MRFLTAVIVLLVACKATAGPIDVLEFENPEHEKRYYSLTKELRCLKCQNSSIAGSNAPLAKDLRLKVYEMIVKENKSDLQIKDWMSARYGDFVLYEPPLKANTIILWGLPIILGCMGFIILLAVVFKKSKLRAANKTLSSEQQEKLDQLLKK